VTIDAYPLTWPHPQPRTAPHARTHAAFKVDTGDSISHLVANLRMLNTRQVIISSNVPTKRDGLPYADFREPTDPGVAVYFDRYVKSTDPRVFGGAGAWLPFVIACDHYTKLRWNLRAIGMTVEALRTIARHGASSMLEQAFTGFAALPPASNGKKPWWEVLGVHVGCTIEEAREAWIELVKIHHPDAGGDTKRMAEINAAFEEAKAS
jgi:hypothetical protein